MNKTLCLALIISALAPMYIATRADWDDVASYPEITTIDQWQADARRYVGEDEPGLCALNRLEPGTRNQSTAAGSDAEIQFCDSESVRMAKDTSAKIKLESVNSESMGNGTESETDR